MLNTGSKLRSLYLLMMKVVMVFYLLNNVPFKFDISIPMKRQTGDQISPISQIIGSWLYREAVKP